MILTQKTTCVLVGLCPFKLKETNHPITDSLSFTHTPDIVLDCFKVVAIAAFIKGYIPCESITAFGRRPVVR